MRPNEPGTYVAREITYCFGGTRILSLPYKVEVVADVPNPRNHKLLVKTGLDHPKYKALECFEWQL